MCLNISINDDDIYEGIEQFVICGSSEQAIEFEGNACIDIFIEDNDGMKIAARIYDQVEMTILSPIVAKFNFSRPIYNIPANGGAACVCLELIYGQLATDVIIEVFLEDEQIGRKSCDKYYYNNNNNTPI